MCNTTGSRELNLSSQNSCVLLDSSVKQLEFMNEAVKQAEENAIRQFTTGGPFGAVVVRDGKIVGSGRNQVLENHDPTAHAEVQAIRNACENLGTHDLTGCILYTSCYPCPMCLAATMWANITEVFFGNTQKDAAAIGFRDDAFYIALGNMLDDKKELNKGFLELTQLGRDITIGTFNKFEEQNGEKY